MSFTWIGEYHCPEAVVFTGVTDSWLNSSLQRLPVIQNQSINIKYCLQEWYKYNDHINTLYFQVSDTNSLLHQLVHWTDPFTMCVVKAYRQIFEQKLPHNWITCFKIDLLFLWGIQLCTAQHITEEKKLTWKQLHHQLSWPTAPWSLRLFHWFKNPSVDIIISGNSNTLHLQ